MCVAVQGAKGGRRVLFVEEQTQEKPPGSTTSFEIDGAERSRLPKNAQERQKVFLSQLLSKFNPMIWRRNVLHIRLV